MTFLKAFAPTSYFLEKVTSEAERPECLPCLMYASPSPFQADNRGILPGFVQNFIPFFIVPTDYVSKK